MIMFNARLSQARTKDKRKIWLYINSENKDVWKAIEYAENLGMNSSSYLCSKIILGWNDDVEIEKDNPDYNYRRRVEHEQEQIENEQKRLLTTLMNNKERTLKNLIEIAKEYEMKGVDESHDISYVLPHMFNQKLITSEDLANLIVFCTKLYLTAIHTNTSLSESCTSFSNRLLSGMKRDINVNTLIKDFKKELISMLDFSSKYENEVIKKHEEEYLRRKQEEKIKKAKELQEIKRKLEIEQWKLMNPNKEIWMKGMTDEDIEISDKIFSGEYAIIDSDNDDYNMEIKTNMSEEHFY